MFLDHPERSAFPARELHARGCELMHGANRS
jgi:hypothetical protein